MREDRRSLAKAQQSIGKGRLEKAKNILLKLRGSTTDERLKVDVDLALITCLNQADNHLLLLEVVDEGMVLSEKFLLSDARAIFYITKATTLLQKQSSIIYAQKCIKLPSEWFNFALEREREEYNRLEKQFVSVDREANELFQLAKSLASKRPATQFQILFNEAQAKSQIIDVYLFKHGHPRRRIFRKSLVWGVSRKDKRIIIKMFDEVKKLYLNAAKILSQDGDPSGYAYSYFHLALAYRTLLKFRRAKFFLKKAEVVALRYTVMPILKRIKEVQKDFTYKKISGAGVDYKDFLKEYKG
jgi:hypothetical protein